VDALDGLEELELLLEELDDELLDLLLDGGGGNEG
jgi:hypothetical protein